MSDALPTLVLPGLPDPARADAPGGFCWWYADLVDDEGNGLVAIVSLGLPFLPGYASAARAGTAPPARQRPSICVSAVRGGRPVFWALHETDPDDLVWEADRVRLGRSELAVSIRDGAVRWEASLAGSLPGCDWRARLSVDGPLRRPSPGEVASAAHEWTVLTAVARGEARLEAKDEVLAISGRAYLDRNAGERSLDGLGVAGWTWGRLALPDRERIWYVATDADGSEHALALTVGPDGRSELALDGARGVGTRIGRWGLPGPAEVVLDPDLRVPLRHAIDESPFYARFLIEGREGEAVGRGFAELCRPGRIDAAWFRPLVRMTVCNEHRPEANSMWLPLFGGPRAGRFGRLGAQWLGVRP